MAEPLERADAALLGAVRSGLASLADPAKAPAMQAYMKSSMPFRGVSSPPRKALAKDLFRTHPLPDFDAWRQTVLALWRGAEYREERYLAIALASHRSYRAHQTPSALPLCEELIVTGAWWDFVDEVTIGLLGPILRASSAAVRPLMLAWRADPDLWRRRSAIICQVGAKGSTDLDLLTACLEPNLPDRDFFIRKAIGWALRDYAWTDPAWVRAWVAAHDGQLSGLSRREALKNIAEPPTRSGGGSAMA